MFGSFRSTLGRATVRGHLMTLVQAASVATGLVCSWLALGAVSVFSMASISAVGLLVVYLLRASGEQQVGYSWGLLSGVLTVCWMGLIASFGLLGVLWVCGLIVTSSAARRGWARVRGQALRRPPRDGAVPTRGRDVPSAARRVEHDLVTARMQRAMRELPHLDAVALCLAWRRSYLQLLDAGSTPDAAAAVVDHRQRILDEIERRDARGLGRWLASGPLPSGNPLPYLHAHTATADRPDGASPPGPDARSSREDGRTS